MDTLLSQERLASIQRAAYSLGQISILELIKVFEAKKIEVTFKGMVAYLLDMEKRNKVLSVVEKADELIAKAEQVLTIPDNVVKFPGKKK